MDSEKATANLDNIRSAVAFVEYFPPYLGSDRRIFELIRRQRTWRVVPLVVPPLRALLGDCEASLLEYFDGHFGERNADGKRDPDEFSATAPIYMRLPPILRRLWQRLFYVAYPFTIVLLVIRSVRIVSKLQPSLVILGHPSYLCGLVGGITAKLCRIPVLLDYPDAWTPLACETAGVRPESLTGRILTFIERRVARIADGATAVTEGVASYARNVGVRSVLDVIPNGVDTGTFDPNHHDVQQVRHELGLSSDDKVFLYAGRIDAHTRVGDLVAGFADLFSAKSKNIKLLIVGDGPFETELLRQRNGHSEQVIFLPPVAYKEMPRVISASDVCVAFFPRTRSTEHGFPLVLLEYLALGKPVICTPLPGIRDVLSGGVLFTDGFAVEDFLERCVLILERDGVRGHLVARARNAAMRLEWNALSARFTEAMDSVLLAHSIKGSARPETRPRIGSTQTWEVSSSEHIGEVAESGHGTEFP